MTVASTDEPVSLDPDEKVGFKDPTTRSDIVNVVTIETDSVEEASTVVCSPVVKVSVSTVVTSVDEASFVDVCSSMVVEITVELGGWAEVVASTVVDAAELTSSDVLSSDVLSSDVIGSAVVDGSAEVEVSAVVVGSLVEDSIGSNPVELA